MTVSRIEHIGIAMPTEEEALQLGHLLFQRDPDKVEVVESQRVKTYIYKVGETKIEFLVPTSDDSSITKFLMDRGQGLHHIALAVDDLPRTIEDLKGRGIRMIDELPREGVENTKIAFAHPKSTGKVLVEFVEGA
ncbi:VOC family protein [Coprothermobacter platensis]|uniref:VOC family protein n=1 Tax=Coprothermobacter platensis TaxID=108819 RepID=UPI0003791D89|nr:VOC family protein [Coprothermobacter platensis]